MFRLTNYFNLTKPSVAKIYVPSYPIEFPLIIVLNF